MTVKELRMLLNEWKSGKLKIPNNTEVVLLMPDSSEDNGVATYASQGAEYDKEKNELVINVG